MSLEPMRKVEKNNLLLHFSSYWNAVIFTSFGLIKSFWKFHFFFYQKVRCFFNLHFHNNNNKWFVCLLENPIDNLTREKKTENFKWRPSLEESWQLFSFVRKTLFFPYIIPIHSFIRQTKPLLDFFFAKRKWNHFINLNRKLEWKKERLKENSFTVPKTFIDDYCLVDCGSKEEMKEEKLARLWKSLKFSDIKVCTTCVWNNNKYRICLTIETWTREEEEEEEEEGENGFHIKKNLRPLNKCFTDLNFLPIFFFWFLKNFFFSLVF